MFSKVKGVSDNFLNMETNRDKEKINDLVKEIISVAIKQKQRVRSLIKKSLK